MASRYISRTLVILENLYGPNVYRRFIESELPPEALPPGHASAALAQPQRTFHPRKEPQAIIPHHQRRHPAEDVSPSEEHRLDPESLPGSVHHVVSSINDAHPASKALLIGGSVRDRLEEKFRPTGRESKDYDIEAYGIPSDRLEQHLGTLGNVKAVGKAFGVHKLVPHPPHHEDDFDISVPRRDSKTGKGHKGFIPEQDPSMTISEAGKRRDFTMNTVAADPLTGHIYDPHGGVEDIKNKTIRATTPHMFSEDPLRILRGAQFASRFDYSVHPETMQLMKDAAGELKDLPRERVGGEWHKLVMKGRKPSVGMDVMKESGVLAALHPELHDMSQDEAHDGAWEHTKRAADHATELTKDADPATKQAVRYATLLHKTGGGNTNQVLRSQFDIQKSGKVKAKEMVDKVHTLAANHTKPHEFFENRDNVTDAHIRHFASNIAPATIGELSHVAHATHATQAPGAPKKFPAGEWLRQKAKDLGVHDGPQAQLLSGKHLMQMGVKPGPHIGHALRHVYKHQLDGTVQNLDQAKAKAAEFLKQSEQRYWPQTLQVLSAW